MEFYHFAVCHFCKKQHSDLKKCSSCKTVFYCSQEHQKNDWKNHKELCKVITKSKQLNKYPCTKTPQNINNYKSILRILWSNELNRCLFSFEEQMWMFPKICSVCYIETTDLTCNECHSVAYCSQSHLNTHKESHHKYCKEFKLNLLLLQQKFKSRINVQIDWDILDLPTSLPENLEKTLNCLGFKKGNNFSEQHINFVELSETFSPICNIIYALEKSDQLDNTKELIIHIVGSDFFEESIDWFNTFQFFANYIPNLNKIDIYCIGPSANDSELDLDNISIKNKSGENVFINFSVFNTLYHEILNDLPKPNVVAVFNSGLHEYCESPEQDSWKMSIPSLIQYSNIPLLITAYTLNELEQDLNRFNSQQIQFLVKPQRNPYSGLKPMRNWQVGEEPIYFQNGYIAILAKKHFL